MTEKDLGTSVVAYMGQFQEGEPLFSPDDEIKVSTYIHLKPYKCPVCDGRCVVKKGFYTWKEEEEGVEQCKSCTRGIVWG